MCSAGFTSSESDILLFFFSSLVVFQRTAVFPNFEGALAVALQPLVDIFFVVLEKNVTHKKRVKKRDETFRK